MLKYLIIPLASDAVSFCHYPVKPESPETISTETLKKAVFWAMKENLSVQFVYPHRQLPQELLDIVDEIDHTDIVPLETDGDSDTISVIDDLDSVDEYKFDIERAYVVRANLAQLYENTDKIKRLLKSAGRLNIVITDVADFKDEDIDKYRLWLDSLIQVVKSEYLEGHTVQFNLLTDRMTLTAMNNCNAGDESITLAPDGSFYNCPGFYTQGLTPVGNLDKGLAIRNPQLYKLTHAPICRECDAFHCKRCIWLNRQLTHEVNTPGHEQCVMAHIERNATRKLISALREVDSNYLPETEIADIDYIDPFDKIIKRIY